MSFDENSLIEQNNTLRTRIATLEQQIEPMKERVRAVCETLAARQKSDGSFDIDFDKLADRLGLEGALELRAAIDGRWKISGAAGEKPRVRVTA